MQCKIKMLDGFNGDCFVIEITQNDSRTNIIVDGGISKTYIRELRDEIKSIEEKEENIDLMFITHVDDDHIGGIISFFEDEEIDKKIVKKVVFNSALSVARYMKTEYDSRREIDINKTSERKMSYQQGKTLEAELIKYELLNEKVTKVNDILNIRDYKIIILSPRYEDIKRLHNKWERETSDKREASCSDNDYNTSIKELLINDKFNEDKSVANISSISFILDLGTCKILMLGDTRSDIVTKSLNDLGYNKENKIIVDYVKLPHHGSANNLYYDLLEVIVCKKFIISTDGSIFNHPDKKTLARIINSIDNVEFYFNSNIYENIFLEEDYQNYQFTCIKKEVIELNDERHI